MQERLLRSMLVCSILFSAASMAVMLYFSATKTIVIAEEAAPERMELEQQADSIQKNMLHFQAGGQESGLKIPLPAEIKADDIIIENRYIEHSIHIILTGKYGEFYRQNALVGNDARVESGFLSEEDGITRLQLHMNGLYEHQYMFENGVLQLSFIQPSQLYDRILVLDAACGGADEGHTGNGIREKVIALEIAEKVKEKLDGSNIRVYCTRTDDTALAAEERAAFANELQADMLVSIRAGADENNDRVFGIQAFYNGTYFIPYLGNIELADLLEKNIVTAVGGKANGLFAAEAEDTLLQNAQVPAAAVSIGYLTNAEEAAFLSAPEYQEKLAEGIVNAVNAAFEVKERNP